MVAGWFSVRVTGVRPSLYGFLWAPPDGEVSFSTLIDRLSMGAEVSHILVIYRGLDTCKWLSNKYPSLISFKTLIEYLWGQGDEVKETKGRGYTVNTGWVTLRNIINIIRGQSPLARGHVVVLTSDIELVGDVAEDDTLGTSYLARVITTVL